MIVKTLWGLRKGEDTPELMVAWDEYCADGNWAGWAEDCEKAIASWGSDLIAHRYVDLEVNGSALLHEFETKTLGTGIV